MGMTKDQYEAAGRAAYRTTPGNAATPLAEGSWQHRAFMLGYEHERMIRLNDMRPENQGINLARMPANTAGWPRAAAEHARLLAADVNNCKDPIRRKRLDRSLRRLQARWIKA